MSEESRRVTVPGSEKAPLPGGKILGDAPDNDVMDVTVRIRRRQELPSVAGAGAGARLSKQDYAERYGAAPEDLAQVEQFARDHGLKVEESSRERRSVILSGRVADFERAFGVHLQSCDLEGERYRTRSGAITIPEELQGIVIGVFGLDDRPFAQAHFRADLTKALHAHAAEAEAQPHAGTAGFPTGFSPTQIARFYNFPTDVDGAGQTIGIIELGGGFRQQELKTYFQGIGVTPPHVEVASFAGGGHNQPGTDALDPENPDIEVMLDIQVAGAVAPGTKMVVYFAPDAQDQSFLDVMTAAVHDPNHDLSVISISWGGPEAAATNQFQLNFNQVLETAAQFGTTVCVASGDNGSADFPLNDPQRPWDGRAHVDFPASSPLVLACGGTRLLVSGGALQNEVVWHPAANEGTGGGVSRAFSLPGYQETAGVPHAANPAGPVRRGVPDVAGDAAQESGYQVLCDGLRFPDPHHQPRPLPPIGGTSAVAPLWAGLIALINQKLGRRVGFVNPALYALPAGSGAFRDITEGNNGDYAAKAGWDPCTGLGVPDGKRLIAALPAHLPPP